MSGTDFENDIFALNVIIDLVYEQNVVPSLDNLLSKYDSVLSNQGSVQELMTLLKPNINTVITMISSEYKTLLLQYFSDDGLIFYIYKMFQKHISM